MDHPCDAKYGMTPEQIKESYIRLQKLGAKEFGMHAFLVSGAMTNKYYPALAEIMFKKAVQLHKETGANFKFINLSGGIGIPYTPDEKANNIAVKICKIRGVGVAFTAKYSRNPLFHEKAL